MIDRHSVIEYVNKNPTHSRKQIGLYFLQTVRQQAATGSTEEQNRHHQVSIGSISNQLNYILRDLEASGTISPRSESPVAVRDRQYSEDFSA
jgi:phage-related minor tail protein